MLRFFPRSFVRSLRIALALYAALSHKSSDEQLQRIIAGLSLYLRILPPYY